MYYFESKQGINNIRLFKDIANAFACARAEALEEYKIKSSNWGWVRDEELFVLGKEMWHLKIKMTPKLYEYDDWKEIEAHYIACIYKIEVEER